MYWPSMIPQPTAAPVVMATSVDLHGATLAAGVLVLIAAVILGLGMLGLAMTD